MTITQIAEKMIAFSDGNLHDIRHFLEVWAYAKLIAEQEKIDDEAKKITEIAALTHDIACPLCRKKYGNTDGRLQEIEGEPLVREFLCGTGLSEKEIDRVAFLVAHHHNYAKVDGIDYQILLESDYIVNASENEYAKQSIEKFMAKVLKTESGTRLLRAVFALKK